MQEPAPFAASPNGSLLICGDGPELLVYHSTGQPHWKQFCDGILVAVGATDQAVVTLDHEGRVRWWRAMDGRALDTSQVDGTALGLSVVEGGAAVLTDQGIALMAPGGIPRLVGGGDASACAFGRDHGRLGVGTRHGTFRAMDPATGEALGEIGLGEPITGVAWSAQGFWVVTAGASFFAISEEGGELVAGTGAQEGPLGRPTVSEDGLLAAATVGEMQVAVFELHTHKRIGQIEFRRRIGGLGFGVEGKLGVGLDDGDANLVDLRGGGAKRTEPHEGRGRNNWNLDIKVDLAAVRGALAMSRAGTTPIAAYTGWRPEDDQGDEGGWWATCLSMGCGCATLLFGCVGLTVLAWIFKEYGNLRFLGL